VISFQVNDASFTAERKTKQTSKNCFC